MPTTWDIYNIQNMEQRITNLEVAIHAMWILLGREFPELESKVLYHTVDHIMHDHYQAAQELGGLRRTHISFSG